MKLNKMSVIYTLFGKYELDHSRIVFCLFVTKSYNGPKFLFWRPGKSRPRQVYLPEQWQLKSMQESHLKPVEVNIII